MIPSLADDFGAVSTNSVRRAIIGDTIFPGRLYVTSTAILSFIPLFVEPISSLLTLSQLQINKAFYFHIISKRPASGGYDKRIYFTLRVVANNICN